jgi:hypothetical protein
MKKLITLLSTSALLLALPIQVVVEITKTVPLEKLVWAPIKDPDNEIKTIHNRTEDPHPSGC